jgi:hypothetical protein
MAIQEHPPLATAAIYPLIPIHNCPHMYQQAFPKNVQVAIQLPHGNLPHSIMQVPDMCCQVLIPVSFNVQIAIKAV